MIVELWKISQSILPFIKEAFLWRDGAEVGKPITEQNLIRRKVAVFAMVISLVINYFTLSKLYEYYNTVQKNISVIDDLQQKNNDLVEKNAELVAEGRFCVKPSELAALMNEHVEREIKAGRLKKTTTRK